jgi:hypothetical protein
MGESVKNHHGYMDTTLMKASNKRRKPRRTAKKAIELPILTGNLTILGLDPGTRNFALFVGKVRVKNDSITKITPIESLMLKHTISDFRFLEAELKAFRKEIGRQLERHKPDIVVIERFQSRGNLGGLLEYANVMLGAVATLTQRYCPEARICIITAAAWKNKINRVRKLDELYRFGKLIGPHRIDAAMLALTGIGIKNPYIYFAERHRDELLIRQLMNL